MLGWAWIYRTTERDQTLRFGANGKDTTSCGSLMKVSWTLSEYTCSNTADDEKVWTTVTESESWVAYVNLSREGPILNKLNLFVSSVWGSCFSYDCISTSSEETDPRLGGCPFVFYCWSLVSFVLFLLLMYPANKNSRGSTSEFGMNPWCFIAHDLWFLLIEDKDKPPKTLLVDVTYI